MRLDAICWRIVSHVGDVRALHCCAIQEKALNFQLSQGSVLRFEPRKCKRGVHMSIPRLDKLAPRRRTVHLE